LQKQGNAVFYCAFKLKKDANAQEFLQAAEKLKNEFISKQQGYVSWQHLHDGDTWADFIVFETMEDVKTFETNSEHEGDVAQHFYSFIDFDSIKQHYYVIEKQ